MTEEEKEAIEIIDNLIAIFKHSIFETVEIYSPDNYRKALKNVKNLIQKQDKEINKLNNVIDRMAEMINSHDIDEDICSKRKNSANEEADCYLDAYYGNEVCKECIKEYFMKEK